MMQFDLGTPKSYESSYVHVDMDMLVDLELGGLPMSLRIPMDMWVEGLGLTVG